MRMEEHIKRVVAISSANNSLIDTIFVAKLLGYDVIKRIYYIMFEKESYFYNIEYDLEKEYYELFNSRVNEIFTFSTIEELNKKLIDLL